MDWYMWFILILFVVVFVVYGIKNIKKIVNESKEKKSQVRSNRQKQEPVKATVEVRTIQPSDPVRVPLSSVRAYNEYEYVDISELDMTTVDGLNAIPDIYFQVGPPNSYGSLYNIVYVLDRQVTAFKKIGDVEMEIFCMRKCKKISETNGLGYGRLASELFRLRMFDEAKSEREYADRLDDAYREREAKKKYSELPLGGRLFKMGSNLECPQCYTLQFKLYSLDHKTIEELNDPKIIYPPDNDMFKYLCCDLCAHVIAITSLVDWQGNLNDLDPVNIDREALETNGADLLNKRRAKIEYDWMYEHMPDDCPKTYSGYIAMKKSNSNNFHSLKDKAESNGIELLPWMDRWNYQPIEKWTTLDIR
ncbi:MAG: hypothetical protein ACI3YH_00210 [Eubacteriales bacterium]